MTSTNINFLNNKCDFLKRKTIRNGDEEIELKKRAKEFCSSDKRLKFEFCLKHSIWQPQRKISTFWPDLAAKSLRQMLLQPPPSPKWWRWWSHFESFEHFPHFHSTRSTTDVETYCMCTAYSSFVRCAKSVTFLLCSNVLIYANVSTKCKYNNRNQYEKWLHSSSEIKKQVQFLSMQWHHSQLVWHYKLHSPDD